MKTKGGTYLKIFGFLEVLIGGAAFAMILWMLSQDPKSFNIFGIEIVKDALWTLVIMYAIAGFQILAGILAIVFSKSLKHANLLKFFGFVLIVIQVASLGTGNLDMTAIIANTATLIVPTFYLYGAILNSNQKKAQNS